MLSSDCRAMKEEERKYFPGASRWDSKEVQEAAQSSLKSAHDLFTTIAGQKQGRSIHDFSTTAQGAIAEFKKLLSLLDSSLKTQTPKRIRKGPLPRSSGINPRALMENPDPKPNPKPPVAQASSQSQRHPPKIPMPSLTLSDSFSLYRQLQPSMLQRRFSETDLDMPTASLLRLDSCVNQASTTMPSRQSFASSISLDGNSFDRRTVQYATSSTQSANDDFSIKFGGKSEQGSTKCVAPAGGCHCSKRRQGLHPISPMFPC